MTPYDPSEAEIDAACELIRAGWSESELRKRSAWAASEPVTAPEVDVDEVPENDTCTSERV